MGIGNKKQIRLEKWESHKDDQGNFIESRTETHNVWADVERMGGSRGQFASTTQLSNTLTFTIRFRPDWWPTGNWKVVFNGRSHTVQSIERQDEDRFNWIITAQSAGKR